MANSKIPYLCGGVVYFLMAQTKPSTVSARDKLGGNRTEHKDANVIEDLIYAIQGSRYAVQAKDISNYRECKVNGSTGIPFNEVSFGSSFDNAIKNEYSAILTRMTEFIEKHIDSAKHTWLVKALLDLIESDPDIKDTDLFYIMPDGTSKTRLEIKNLCEFQIQPFLIGTWHYVLQHRRDKNTEGIPTLNAWGTKVKYKERTYIGNAGDSITRNISVTWSALTPAVEPSTETAPSSCEILTSKLIDSAQAMANILKNTIGTLSDEATDQPCTPLTPTRYDSEQHIIYIGITGVKLPIVLTPESAFASHDLPYINALCEVYAEKIGMAITPDELPALNQPYKQHFLEQRKAYYGAESVHHSVREVFADGEAQFAALKEDAYEGISPALFDDSYATGYDRLRAVLDKITNTTLSKSALVNIVGLISNLEKKGICHLLVNDDKIKSWVHPYDENI